MLLDFLMLWSSQTSLRLHSVNTSKARSCQDSSRNQMTTISPFFLLFGNFTFLLIGLAKIILFCNRPKTETCLSQSTSLSAISAKLLLHFLIWTPQRWRRGMQTLLASVASTNTLSASDSCRHSLQHRRMTKILLEHAADTHFPQTLRRLIIGVERGSYHQLQRRLFISSEMSNAWDSLRTSCPWIIPTERHVRR